MLYMCSEPVYKPKLQEITVQGQDFKKESGEDLKITDVAQQQQQQTDWRLLGETWVDKIPDEVDSCNHIQRRLGCGIIDAFRGETFF